MKRIALYSFVLLLAALGTQPRRFGMEMSGAYAMDLNEMVAKAKTASDHQAIARHYDFAKANARMEVENHLSAAQVYRSSGMAASASHCEQIATSYAVIANEFAALAADHRRVAETLR
jgi:hypothetical protein